MRDALGGTAVLSLQMDLKLPRRVNCLLLKKNSILCASQNLVLRKYDSRVRSSCIL